MYVRHMKKYDMNDGYILKDGMLQRCLGVDGYDQSRPLVCGVVKAFVPPANVAFDACDNGKGTVSAIQPGPSMGQGW